MLGQGQGNENNKVNTIIHAFVLKLFSHPARLFGESYENPIDKNIPRNYDSR